MIHRMGRAIVAALVLGSFCVSAQLTPEQKVIDLQTIASLYAKQYAPYEWKRDNFGFDLFNLRPWLERARQTKTDLEYLDLAGEYLANLQDIHSYYIANSDYSADLHLYTDIYDGKVLIEQIDRSYLPARQFDFAVGDEIVLFDGKPVMEVVDGIAKLTSFGNPRSTRRWAADQLVYRIQAYLPSTPLLGDSAVILVRRQDGSEKSYTIPWDTSGTPILKLGPLPNFQLGRSGVRDEGRGPSPEASPTEAAPEPAYRKPWLSLQRHKSRPVKSLRGFGARDPIYRLPVGFQQRLGRVRSDYFYSGTIATGGKRVGFIRIGTFEPASFGLISLAIQQFGQEIGYMKANTDVLVIDVTRNEGGFACYAEELERYVIPKPFTALGVEIRPNLDLVRDFEYAYLDAIDFGEDWEVALYGALLKDIKTAYSENRGRTGPMPLCGPSLNLDTAKDRNGAVLAYDKPILLVTDEFSTSAADSFAAVVQDAGAAKLFGYRTAGAGGNTVEVQNGFFSEGSTAVTQMMTVRSQVHQAPGFPATRYVENVGVQPDVPYDYQIRENLISNGAPFVDAFLKAAVALVQ